MTMFTEIGSLDSKSIQVKFLSEFLQVISLVNLGSISQYDQQKLFLI